MNKVYVVFMSLYDTEDYDVHEEYYVAGVFSDLEKAKQASKDVIKEYEDYNEYDDVWTVDSWIKEYTVGLYEPDVIYKTFVEGEDVRYE